MATFTMMPRLIVVLLIAFILSFRTGYTQQRVCPTDFRTKPTAPNITRHPSNETKDVGEMTFCVCEFNNTLDFPFWRINKTSYAITNLPSIYQINETGLIFEASGDLQNTLFQCYFIFCTELEGCCEIPSSPGYLTIRQQVDPRQISNCKPEIIEVLVPGTQDNELAALAWLPNPDCDLPPPSYTAEIATCQLPSLSPSLKCAVNTSELSTDMPIVGAFKNIDCPSQIEEVRPILFRVKTGPSLPGIEPDKSAYLYTRELNNTDILLAEIGKRIQIERPGDMCPSGYLVCIHGQMYRKCFNLLNLPSGHSVENCNSTNVLCIDPDQSMNGSVYTLLCPQLLSTETECNIKIAVNVLTHNFLLIVNSTDSGARVCSNFDTKSCLGGIIGVIVGIICIIFAIIGITLAYWKRKHIKCCCQAEKYQVTEPDN